MANENNEGSLRSGLIWGLGSYLLWGFFPIFWKLLADVSPIETLSHRIIWSFVFYLAIYVASTKINLTDFKNVSKNDWVLITIASALLTLNWGLYVNAVITGHILAGSLAYYINPILNVVIGVVFFKEKFPWPLKLAFGFAILAVIVKTVYSDQFPWLSVVLAITFCCYGVTKKLIKSPARISSILESGVAVLPAIACASYFAARQNPPHTFGTWILFALGGIITGLPLFLFSYAAQRVPLSILGIIQFISPTLQAISGVFLFDEEFGMTEIIVFGLIWLGVICYGLNTYLQKLSDLRKPKLK